MIGTVVGWVGSVEVGWVCAEAGSVVGCVVGWLEMEGAVVDLTESTGAQPHNTSNNIRISAADLFITYYSSLLRYVNEY